MKRPAHRCPKKSRGFSWARVPQASGGLAYRLYRYDMRGVMHAKVLRFDAGTDRTAITPILRTARRELREFVDDIDLKFMGVINA